MMEFYPMPMFLKLPARDIQTSMKWYKQVLDFSSIFELPGSDGNTVMAHLRGEKYQDIMLVAQANLEARAGDAVICFASNDVDKIFERATLARGKIVEGPVNRPWNARELVMLDPDGYVITVSTVIDRSMAFDEVIDNVP